MGVYYPQACVELRILWENFKKVETGEFLKEEQRIKKEEKTYNFTVWAKSVGIQINDHTEADTCNITLDYKTFPFDPRTVRSCGVVVYLDDVKAPGASPTYKKIVPRNPDNVAFVGFVDTQSINFDESSLDVEMEARDYTAFFLDESMLSDDSINIGKKIVDKKNLRIKRSAPIFGKRMSLLKVLQILVAERAATKTGISVVLRLTKDKNYNYEKDEDKVIPKVDVDYSLLEKSVDGSYWGFMTKVCNRYGLICFMEKTKLIVTKPQNLFEDREVVQFVYGINIQSLNFERRLGRKRGFNLVIRSANFSSKKNTDIFVELPKEPGTSARFKKIFGSQENKIPEVDAMGNRIEDKPAEKIYFSVPAVSKKKLIAMGEKTYEEMSRQEIAGSLTTKDMEFFLRTFVSTETLGSKGREIDFKFFRVGTPIEIIFNHENLIEIRSLSSPEKKENYLLKRGFPPEIAKVFADTMDKVSFRFYTTGINMTLNDQGFKMSLDFINFIELGDI